MELKNYIVTVGFAGFVGVEEEYEILARDKDDAELDAYEEAASDLSIESVDHIEDDEWEVTINFAGYIGADQTYTVFANDEDEASDSAIEEAEQDLEILNVDEIM